MGVPLRRVEEELTFFFYCGLDARPVISAYRTSGILRDSKEQHRDGVSLFRTEGNWAYRRIASKKRETRWKHSWARQSLLALND